MYICYYWLHVMDMDLPHFWTQFLLHLLLYIGHLKRVFPRQSPKRFTFRVIFLLVFSPIVN